MSDGREIPLTRGQVALVSEHRYEELAKFKWYARWNKPTRSFYAMRSSLTSEGLGKTILMHRVILGLRKGDGIRGDHRNCDTLDNRDENLRIATASQNNSNSRLSRLNTSGLKGVSYFRKYNNWRVQIAHEGKVRHVGYFPLDKKEEAHQAYCEAAVRLHGEFARAK